MDVLSWEFDRFVWYIRMGEFCRESVLIHGAVGPTPTKGGICNAGDSALTNFPCRKIAYRHIPPSNYPLRFPVLSDYRTIVSPPY